MKLSHITLSVIALAGIAGVGGSYFTGKQAEQRYPEYIANINQHLKQQVNEFFSVELKVQQFDRHFFSSDVKYSVELTLNNEHYSFPASDKLYHGPFPINRLAKGNVLPVAVSMDSTLNLPEVLKNLSDTQVPFLTAHSNLSYAGNLKSDLTTQSIKNELFELAALQVNFEGNFAGKGKWAMNLPSLKYISDNGVIFAADNVRYQSHLTDDQGYARLGIGTAAMQVDKFNITQPDQNSHFAYQNIIVKGKNELNNERYIGDLDFSTNLVIGSGNGSVDLGKLSVNLMVESDAKLTNDIFTYDTPEAFSSPQAVEIWQELAKKGAKLHINPLKLSNDQGAVELQLVLNSKPTESLTFDNINAVLALLQKSHVKLNLDLGTIQGIISQAAQLQGLDAEQATAQSAYVISLLKNQAEQVNLLTNVFKIEEKQISTDLSIDDGKISLNGRILSEQELQHLLLMIGLSLGGF